MFEDLILFIVIFVILLCFVIFFVAQVAMCDIKTYEDGTWPRRPRRTCRLEGETGPLCFLGLLTVCGGGPHRSHFVIK